MKETKQTESNEVITKPTLKIKFSRLNEQSFKPQKLGEEPGLCVRATERVTIGPFKIDFVHTGIVFEIPEGYEMEIRNRNTMVYTKGLVIPHGVLRFANTFKGELIVPLKNSESYTKGVDIGDPIANVSFVKVEEYEAVD